MSSVTIKQLLESGVHFGHQTQRWNPKMKKYIFGERNGIHIINLEITLTYLEKGLAYVRKLAAEGKDILFIGTKKQAQDCIRAGAEMCEMPFVNQRWLGGMLTNFETVRKSLSRLDTIDRMEKDGSFQFITKKEAASLKKEREKLEKTLAGIRTMRRIPSAVFVIDAKKEEIAIKEARKLGIPVIAVLDTNCDPDMVDYAFPGNDDAIRAIKLFCELVGGTIKEGRDEFKKIAADKAAAAEKELADEQAAQSAMARAMKGALDEEVIDKDATGIIAAVEDDAVVRDAVISETKIQKAKTLKKVVRKESGRDK